ncbi:MAG: ParA family protein [Hungatella sp.]
MATIIALTNQKGGVGKTTTACALADGLAAKGKKVLGIDLDPQGNMGFSLGLDIENCHTLYDVFKKVVPARQAIQHTDCCDMISSDIMLSSVELEFNGAGREFLLRNAIADVAADYDYIVIDTPPSLNILTVNAYVVANHLIIPMSPEILSLLGVAQIKETVDNVRASFNPNLNVLGILLTKYNRRTLLAQEVSEMADNIAKQLNTVVFQRKIRTSVAAAEAPAHGESILTYAPKSNPAFDYSGLISEIATALKIN